MRCSTVGWCSAVRRPAGCCSRAPMSWAAEPVRWTTTHSVRGQPRTARRATPPRTAASSATRASRWWRSCWSGRWPGCSWDCSPGCPTTLRRWGRRARRPASSAWSWGSSWSSWGPRSSPTSSRWTASRWRWPPVRPTRSPPVTTLLTTWSRWQRAHRRGRPTASRGPRGRPDRPRRGCVRRAPPWASPGASRAGEHGGVPSGRPAQTRTAGTPQGGGARSWCPMRPGS